MRSTIALALVALVGGLTTVPASPAAAAGLNTDDRAAVGAAYRSSYAPALATPLGWTGSVAGCLPGAPSPAAQASTLTVINFVRSLGGLDPVSFDPALSDKAQQAALVYLAQGNLSHSIPPTWKCATPDAIEAGGKSNIAYGRAGAQAIDLYMSDYGSNNTAAGHRRWIMDPDALTMGSGSTSSTNALWILGKHAAAGQFSNPTWVSWPTKGYFPSQLEPQGRWSLTANASGKYDFSGAKVSVVDSNGAALGVSVYPAAQGYANDTLVWEVSGVQKPTGSQTRAYTVSVTGIKTGVTTVSTSYKVNLIDASYKVPDQVSAVQFGAGLRITGVPRVGQTLVVNKPAVSPASARIGYQWYRNGVVIPGATGSKYKVASGDLGKSFRVRLTGALHGYTSASSTSPATARVTPAIKIRVTKQPQLSGKLKVGRKLTVTSGTWSPGASTIKFQWKRNGVSIKGATGRSYKLKDADRGKKITVIGSVSKTGYVSTSLTLGGKKKVAR